ncbi:lipolytic enzyme [Tricladium varicosporioides]|nr:lipolytic enzyme [Hymenoscyphus varicosporioides]
MFSSVQLSVLSVLLSTICLTPVLGSALPEIDLGKRQDGYHWVDTWASMPQLVEPDNLPPAPYKTSPIIADATLRQTFHFSIAASKIRIQFSNTFGTSDLPITAASLALPLNGKAGSGSIVPSTLKGLTFGGAQSVVVPKGKTLYSDAIDFEVAAQSMLTLSIYSKAGQSGSSITGHPGSRTTSWFAAGNKVNETAVSGASTKHWYFVTFVEAWVPANASALMILGDSITDGRGSTDDENNRWPDLVLARMQKSGITNIGVNNQAAGGNCVLSQCLGPSLVSRYSRDGLTASGAKYIMIFEGVNDLGQSGSPSGTADQLISAFKTITSDAHKLGMITLGATITPLGTSYSNSGRETARNKVNSWIRASGGAFDFVVDFDKAVGDSGGKLVSKYNGGDGLHPNVAGYQAMADAFDLAVFSK